MLRDYQKRAIEAIENTEGNCCLQMATGSGKTFTMGSDSQPTLMSDDLDGDLGNAAAGLHGVETEQANDGIDWESCGLIPRFMTDIFAALEQMASIKDENGQSSSFRLAASFIEVYGDDMPTYIR